MSYIEEDTIFVVIPCYRDSELLYTLEDMYEKANKPENIFCGIFLQKDMKNHEDDDLFIRDLPRKDQLRIVEVDYREPRSVCLSIGSANDLYKNEKFVFKIDSHMRFKKNFDKTFIEKLEYIKDKKKIDKVAITIKPNNYELYPTKTDFNTKPTRIGLINEKQHNVIRFGKSCKTNTSLLNITNAVYCACLFYNVVDGNNLKYNKYCGICDELLYSMILFTNGYKIFLSDEMLVNHLYYDKKYNIYENFKKSRGVGYSRNIDPEYNMEVLSNMQKTKDPEVLENINKYGLGKERTLRDYERFSGVNFKKKTTREHAKEGIFENWQEVSKLSDISNIFTNNLLCNE